MEKESREIPNDEDNPFVSIGELLSENISVATLATAIEKKGIFTWDKFGRFGKASKEDEGRAFGSLASVHEWEIDREWEPPGSHPTEQNPVDARAGAPTPFSSFGWAKEVLPNFNALRDAQNEIPQKPGATVKRKAPDAFVAALTRLLVEIAKRDANLNISKMPGIKTDFHELAEKFDAKFKCELSTFDSYIGPFCQFKRGSHSLPYYRDLFKELFE